MQVARLRRGCPGRGVLAPVLAATFLCRNVGRERLGRRVPVDADGVGLVAVQRRQIVERVLAVLVGDDRADRVAIHVRDRLAVRADQAQRDACDAGLPLVLHTVAVLVDPDVVPDRHGLQVHARVPGRVHALRGVELAVIVGRQRRVVVVQRDQHGGAGRRVGIRIGRVVVTAVQRGELVLLRLFVGQREGDDVVTRRQIIEQVPTLGVGDGRRHLIAVDVRHRSTLGVGDRHRHPRQHLFVRILDAVAIAVDPGEVADRVGLLDHAGVPGGVDALRRPELLVGVVGGQRLVRVIEREWLGDGDGRVRLVRGAVGVDLVGIDAGLDRGRVDRGEDVPFRLLVGQREAHLVGAGRQVVEQVPPIGVRRGLHRLAVGILYRVSVTVEQFDGHTGQDSLVTALDAITIAVDPGVVADRVGQRVDDGLAAAGDRVHDVVAAGAGHAHGEEDGVGTAAGIALEGTLPIGDAKGDDAVTVTGRQIATDVLRAGVGGVLHRVVEPVSADHRGGDEALEVCTLR